MHFKNRYANIQKHKNKREHTLIHLIDLYKGVKTMANIKSAKKRVKVNAAKAANNKARNSALKTAIKKANAAIENNADNKEEAVKDAVKLIDKAASKNLIHKNTAARKKSNLAKKVNG